VLLNEKNGFEMNFMCRKCAEFLTDFKSKNVFQIKKPRRFFGAVFYFENDFNYFNHYNDLCIA